ncbi:MAG: exodeoxyribonuclease VII small subunit [Actinomycetia bacterium]|nr:exodeoxyribonuclease VII small subunit [Actinomycetes bacterium]
MSTTEELTFQQATTELETILRQLEGNQLELEASLTAYERGVVLLRLLQGRLQAAQQQVTLLMGEAELDSADNVDSELS